MANGLQSGKYIVSTGAAGYGQVYYPGVPNSSKAEEVTVTAPAVTENINMNISPEATISGTVRDTAGKPMAGVEVRAWPTGGGWIYSDVTDSNGFYMLQELATSDYNLYGRMDGYAHAFYDDVGYYYSYGTPVLVWQPHNTGNIDLVMRREASIGIQVYAADGTTPVEGVYAYFLVSPVVFSAAWAGAVQMPKDICRSTDPLPPVI